MPSLYPIYGISDNSSPVCPSQSRTVLSTEPEASFCPSGDQATPLTPSVWPSRVCSSLPVCPSQSHTVLSAEPEASLCPSGDQARLKTLLVRPARAYSAECERILFCPSIEDL